MEGKSDDKTKSVKIEGDKDGFNSKSAINKFKLAIKLNNSNVEELTNKYIKNGYLLEKINETENEYTYLVKKKTDDYKTDRLVRPSNDNREKLKMKLHNMSQTRTNAYYNKAKVTASVPNDILTEYNKLIKISKIPVPEPTEILANPDNYKQIITMVLSNNMTKKLPQNHPYIKYFKLLAQKLGFEQPLPMPTQDYLNSTPTLPNNLDDIINMAGPKTNMTGNEINKCEDTDSD
jgi:hypothetical protein